MQNEIDIFYVASKIRSLLKEHAKFVLYSLLLVSTISISSFFYIRFNPVYVISFQIKSKIIGVQEIAPFEAELNHFILQSGADTQKNPLIGLIKKNNISHFSIGEIVSEASVLRNAAVEDHYYELKISVKNEIEDQEIENIKVQVVSYLRNRLNNTEVGINKKIFEANIKELSYILDSTYSKKISNGGNSFVIENMYKGLSDLQQLKSNTIFRSKFYELENILLSDYPAILSHKIKYPWIVFFIGLVFWVVSVSSYLLWKVLFQKSES